MELEIVFCVDGVEFSNEWVEVLNPSEESIIAALKAKLAVNDDELIEIRCVIDIYGNEFC